MRDLNEQNSLTYALLDRVSFNYGDKSIINEVSMKFERAKITAIMGPSGTGKSTILRLLSGQLPPHKGKVIINGTDINNISRNQLFTIRKKMSMLFQANGLFTDLSVFDNVAFPLREHLSLSEQMVNDLVMLKLQTVGLRSAFKLNPGELSGGMARRVALARALALDPHFMMYDEPFVGQDPVTMEQLISLIKTLNRSLGMTSVLVSHDIAETLRISDYVYVIAEQKILAEGTPDEIKNNSDPRLLQFISGKVNSAFVENSSESLGKDLGLC